MSIWPDEKQYNTAERTLCGFLNMRRSGSHRGDRAVLAMQVMFDRELVITSRAFLLSHCGAASHVVTCGAISHRSTNVDASKDSSLEANVCPLEESRGTAAERRYPSALTGCSVPIFYLDGRWIIAENLLFLVM
jgi:hypothetical protein